MVGNHLFCWGVFFLEIEMKSQSAWRWYLDGKLVLISKLNSHLLLIHLLFDFWVFSLIFFDIKLLILIVLNLEEQVGNSQHKKIGQQNHIKSIYWYSCWIWYYNITFFNEWTINDMDYTICTHNISTEYTNLFVVPRYCIICK